MKTPKPKVFIASNYTVQITHRALGPLDKVNPRGTYHDTWADAQAAILARVQKTAQRAKCDLESADRAVFRAQSMKPQAEAA